MHWRRKWQPTPVFLPGESQGRGSAGVQPRRDPGGTLRMNGVSEREREKTRETSLDGPSLQGRERERERERDQTGGAESGRVWQSLAMLYFLP